MEEEGFSKVKGSFTSAPARQEYSHSASVGKRKLYATFFFAASAVSFFRNSCASSHETFSTGKSSVLAKPFRLSLPSPSLLKQDGFSPMTALYCFCVTSNLPR